ncbi:hypothetical protein ACF0H5_011882 [Mactra antiquata]
MGIFCEISFIVYELFLQVIGLGVSAIGGVLRFHTEMFGYLTPLMKLLPSGGFTGYDVWTIYNYTSIAMICLGIIIGSLGILGCWIGSCTRLLQIVINLVLIILIILIQVLVTVLILTTKINDDIKEPLTKNLYNHYTGDLNRTDDYTVAWNYMFVEFSCCGSENSNDFKSTIKWDRMKTDENGTTYEVEVPVTCCQLPEKYPDFGQPLDENCTTSPSTENSFYDESCYDKFGTYLRYYSVFMSASCGGSIFFEMITVFTLISMCLEIKRRRNKVKQALINNEQTSTAVA